MARRRKGVPVHGWLVVDKPPGLTSTQTLARARRALNAEKAGHGGTLDPIATGVLPIAFGEATKTVAYAMDGRKVYRFTVRFGERRSSDDCEGEVVETSDHRPMDEAIRTVLPRFVGPISQIPPIFSAIKVDGARAYDLARGGAEPTLQPRLVHIGRLDLLARPDPNHAEFEVECGKGTYVRALARDMAAALGSVGHVTALRRLRVGPFSLDRAISLDDLDTLAHGARVERHLCPIETALDDIPALALTDAEAHRLRLGQAVPLFRRGDRECLANVLDGVSQEQAVALAICGGKPVALVRVEGAEVHPMRVLNL